MANRYWVGGTGTWNTTSTTNWSASPGGASGASVPTAADSVFFDRTGTYTVTMTGALACLDFNVSAGTITFATGTSPTLTISGSMSITNVTPTWSSTGQVTFNATTSKTVATNGVTFQCAVVFNGAGGTWTLQSALTTGNTRVVNLTAGTLNLNNFTLTPGAFFTSNSNTRTLAFGTSGRIVTTNTTSTSSILSSTGTGLTITGTPVFHLTGTTSGFDFGSAAAGWWSETNVLDVIAGSPTGAAGVFVATSVWSLNWAGAVKNVNLTGTTVTVSGTASTIRRIFGNLTLASTTIVTGTTSNFEFSSSTGTQLITFNGAQVDANFTFTGGVGATYQLQDALTLTGTTRIVNLTRGTLDLNGKTLTTGSVNVSNTNTRTLNMAGASVVLTAQGGAWNASTTTGLTLNASGSTITLNSSIAKSFASGGLTYGTIVQAGAGILTISGTGATFANIQNTVQPTTVRFTSSETFNFSAFSLSGTSGNLVTIDATTAGTRATISDASGTINVNFCSIKDSNATGGATWNAYTTNGNVNAGNNLGWIFTAPPTAGGNFLLMF